MCTLDENKYHAPGNGLLPEDDCIGGGAAGSVVLVQLHATFCGLVICEAPAAFLQWQKLARLTAKPRALCLKASIHSICQCVAVASNSKRSGLFMLSQSPLRDNRGLTSFPPSFSFPMAQNSDLPGGKEASGKMEPWEISTLAAKESCATHTRDLCAHHKLPNELISRRSLMLTCQAARGRARTNVLCQAAYFKSNNRRFSSSNNMFRLAACGRGCLWQGERQHALQQQEIAMPGCLICPSDRQTHLALKKQLYAVPGVQQARGRVSKRMLCRCRAGLLMAELTTACFAITTVCYSRLLMEGEMAVSFMETTSCYARLLAGELTTLGQYAVLGCLRQSKRIEHGARLSPLKVKLQTWQ
eukprot:1157750-Pelagomonas_calceolata.AAC.7